VTGLRRSYGSQVVLDGIDLHVPEGTVFSLLGPNGAGKTTVVQILSTLIRADAGEVRVGGHDVLREPDRVRAAIGVTGQFSAVDDFLTGEENLLLMADLNHLGRAEGRRRAADLLERFDLGEAAKQAGVTYSGGMRRRLDLAMGLIGDPRVIFLDEPTTGLDPRSRRDMWQIVRDLVARGVTVLLTTQYLEEADQLADRIALLDHGRLVAEGTPAELKRLAPGGHVELRFADDRPGRGRRGPGRRAGPGRRVAAAAGARRRRRPLAQGPARPPRRRLGRRGRAGRAHTRPRRRVLRRDRPSHLDHRSGSDRTMTTITLAVRDSATMLRRQLRHMSRAWSVTLMLLAVPIVLLLLFVYVLGGMLGGMLGDGLGGGSGGRDAYVGYVTPGILLITITGAVQGTAISVAIDMTAGIIARFRTMAIARVSVLTGHVLGSVLHTLFSLAVVLGVAVLVGFRPNATAVEWLAVTGVLTATTFALV
jgi:ABC-2 type transport system ATP-binding protein